MDKPKNRQELVDTLKYLACDYCGHAVNIPQELLDEVDYLNTYEKLSVKKETKKATEARARMRPAPVPGVMT